MMGKQFHSCSATVSPMMSPEPTTSAPAEAAAIPQPVRSYPPMPLWWRGAILACVLACTGLAYLLGATAGPKSQAAFGIVAFLGVVAMFSKNLRAVNWKTFAWGVALQFVLALLVTQVGFVRQGFEWVGEGIKVLIACSDKGAEFVFGDLAKIKEPLGFVFAFKALPPIIFVSAFFSVLYYFGVLQFLVKIFAKVMMYFLGTSGAETLSVSANVFMGQTEAPLIVKPFVPRMTESELLTLMASGMAHISGGMMAVYISYGADPASILCTCVMACPASLYLSKLLLPELANPVTSGDATIKVEQTAVNPIDAAASGVKDGLFLALNVAAMLIGFIAFIAFFDAIIGKIWPGLSLNIIFGHAFSPVAYLMGVPLDETNTVGQLLGTKLAANEHVAYLNLKEMQAGANPLSERSKKLAVYALTGFANFASIGIQLGGIGAMAPERRKDLAKLGLRALFVGFLVTLVNAAIAGLLM